jgi:putative spermidine/putrescine transport system permease protein
MILLERSHRIAIALAVALILLYLTLPVLIIFPVSFGDSASLRFPPPGWSMRWYEAFLGSHQWLGAAATSFQVATLTMLISVPIGTAASYGLTACKMPGARYAYVLLMTPMIIPIIIIAVGVFAVFSKMGLVGSMGGLVLAHVLLAIPYVLLTVGAGLRSFDVNQEMAARSLGVNRAKAFATVTLPQIRTSVFVAAVFSFLSSLDEVVIALFIARGETTTLTREMFLSIREQVDPTIAAVSSLLVSVTVMVAALAYASQQRSAKAEHRTS